MAFYDENGRKKVATYRAVEMVPQIRYRLTGEGLLYDGKTFAVASMKIAQADKVFFEKQEYAVEIFTKDVPEVVAYY
jgi:hypothetical protein